MSYASSAGPSDRKGRCRPVSPVALLAALTLLGSSLAARPGHRPAPPQVQRAAPWEATPFAAEPAAILRAAAEVEAGDGDPVAVLYSETRFSYDEAGRETYTHRIVYRLLTAAAHESWSALEESWSPWHQERPEVRARVISPDGAVHPLDPQVITESGEVQDGPDMFGDGRVLRAPLPATGPGAVVEEEVTLRETTPFFAGGTVRYADLAMGVGVHRAHLVLEAPTDLPLKWVARRLPETAPKVEIQGGRRRLTFDYKDIPPLDEPATGLPPDVARTSYVAFSTGSSWADIAHRYSATVDGAIRGADMTGLIKSAGGAATSQLETMNRLLARIGEIRYTGVELGQSGIVPRTPAETLKRKFGDCKDKSVLLAAALRALDIPAYVALLNAGENEQEIEADLPGFGAFNHAIVVVPGSPSLWIDPTDRFARAGELPLADQGRLVLVASPTATGLTRTPEASAADNRSRKTREIFLADLGGARAIETTEYAGSIERDLRAYYAGEDSETMREALTEYFKKALLAKELTAVEHSDPFDLTQPFHLRLEAREVERAQTDARLGVIALQPGALLDQLPDEISVQERPAGREPRRADYFFGQPFTAELRYRIVPPAGFSPQPLPPSRVRQLGPVTLAEEYATEPGGVVTATLRLDTGKRRISSQEFEQTRQGVREISQAKPI
ncbi:MAG: DUF3857 domain-containing protein, partial [Acidobacteriota bacterium]|nr:DUF3857 domain-containing protein [Acidobacteriota bacterium]